VLDAGPETDLQHPEQVSPESAANNLQPRRPVRVGQLVQAGAVIGYEGNTGRSTGAHLDWRVMRSGEFVNPRLFL
jgi:murein DD-endopeptidase MepM/ murein hydrolase activator NlpD